MHVSVSRNAIAPNIVLRTVGFFVQTVTLD